MTAPLSAHPTFWNLVGKPWTPGLLAVPVSMLLSFVVVRRLLRH